MHDELSDDEIDQLILRYEPATPTAYELIMLRLLYRALRKMRLAGYSYEATKVKLEQALAEIMPRLQGGPSYWMLEEPDDLFKQ